MIRVLVLVLTEGTLSRSLHNPSESRSFTHRRRLNGEGNRRKICSTASLFSQASIFCKHFIVETSEDCKLSPYPSAEETTAVQQRTMIMMLHSHSEYLSLSAFSMVVLGIGQEIRGMLEASENLTYLSRATAHS
jgi:hypothetical protein